MRRALELAGKAMGWTSPNPMVGAVIVKEGRIVGEGYHQRAGTPHAEVHALRRAGEQARGATLYVTLEPCSHYGRTPPCTEAVIRAGITRVVAAMTDPNPLVAGRGLAALREAGIQVEVGLLGHEAARLNEVFVKYITTGLPWVVMKAAMTMDGRIATRTGHSRWVTGEESRLHVHRLRHRYDAIMVGIGTVLADNPLLTTRLPEHEGKQPLRVILDSRLRLPVDARVVRDTSDAGTLVATTERHDPGKKAALEERGVEVAVIPGLGPRVDLPALMRLLGQRQITGILLEGGSEVNAAALAAGIVDKTLFFIAPKIVGGAGAPGPVGGKGVSTMEKAQRLKDVTVERFGPDLLVSGYLEKGEP
ncbi:DeoR faimly transcriptional regulator [Clostridiales bacterium PH28_bin88]|nr:DeoR faimly transcriptional regulator [Clostridiales bacterium PH28_bin88]